MRAVWTGLQGVLVCAQRVSLVLEQYRVPEGAYASTSPFEVNEDRDHRRYYEGEVRGRLGSFNKLSGMVVVCVLLGGGLYTLSEAFKRKAESNAGGKAGGKAVGRAEGSKAEGKAGVKGWGQ